MHSTHPSTTIDPGHPVATRGAATRTRSRPVGSAATPRIATDYRGARLQLREAGFAHVPGDAHWMSPSLASPLEALRQSFERLPVDEHVRAKERKDYRLRRLGSFKFDPVTATCLPRPHGTFYQSAAVNRLYGGEQRVFAPLEASIANNPGLHELIRHDVRVMAGGTRRPFLVQVHQIRIAPTADYAGWPAPEGPHQDGHDYIGQHLFARVNISGGRSTVYSTAMEPLASVTLRDFMDSIYVNDRRVLHGVSEVMPEDPGLAAARDMLLIDIRLTDVL